MSFRNFFFALAFALAVFCSSSALAQQQCYWPDGSILNPTQGYWVNCYSSQDSTCCLNGEVCLSNGLCYGAVLGQTYRGACTVKDWSNTTACPTQWCNDVEKSSWYNLWKCPPLNNGAGAWWCGNESETAPCQGGNDAHFVNYTSAHILGYPPITSSSSAPTISPSSPATSTLSAGPNLKTTTEPTSADISASAQMQAQSTTLPTAIGAGIGVPLGIAAIGLLGFLFWKEAVRQSRSKPRLDTGGQFVAAAVDRSKIELPDTQFPRELGGNGRTELDNT